MQWSLVITFMILGVSLLIASVLRANIRFLQRFLIPNAITGGFVGLAIMYITAKFYPDIMPAREVLGNIVYHLLAVTFISIGLKKRKKYLDRSAVSTTFTLTLGYAVEGFLGYTITLGFLYTFMPHIFPTFGMLFEIGFGQSSGQAYALGLQWEKFGFENGGTVGLTFGAIGFLWACFVGIPILNWGVKRGYIKGISKENLENRGFYPRGKHGGITGYRTTHPDVIASGSFHLAFIGFIYLFDYFFIKLLVKLLMLTGSGFALQLGKILWAYHAFFATLFSLLAGRILDAMNRHDILDDDTLTGISASSVDFLVTAAIMAIELVVVARYIVPIIVICVVGGALTTMFVFIISRWSFEDHVFERALSIFGLLTGTVSTGLALLRVVDPEYRTPAASDLVLGSGFSLFLGFPLLLLINLPVLYPSNKTYLLTDGMILFYIVLVFVVMWLLKLVKPGKSIK